MKEVYPPMHTLEHLLNQTMIRLFGTGRCFSAHIEAKKSKCDYHFERDLDDLEIKKIEDTVNEVIARNLPVTAEFISQEEAAKLYDLSRLPAVTNNEPLRIIKVGDYDACPCSGVHVNSTKEIGKIIIISHDFADNILRLRYKLINS